MMDTNRSIVTYIVLTIITCGIYGYWFLYKMAQDTNVMCEGDGKSTPGLLTFIVLSILTCSLYSVYWYYCLGNRLAMNAQRYGMRFEEDGTTILLWYLVGSLLCGIGPLIAMYILIKNMNALSNAYNMKSGI